MGKLLYDGFLKIELIQSEIKGKVVERENLIIKDAVAGIVMDKNKKNCISETI